MPGLNFQYEFIKQDVKNEVIPQSYLSCSIVYLNVNG